MPDCPWNSSAPDQNGTYGMRANSSGRSARLSSVNGVNAWRGQPNVVAPASVFLFVDFEETSIEKFKI
jgi:hypothetical protein